MSEWKKVKLGEISQTIQTGPFGSQLHQSDYSVIGIPVVMPKDIIAGNIEEASIARVEQHHIDRLSRHMISYGDILYARRGDVGKCAFTKQNQEGWLCGTGCLRVTINPDMANPKFVFFQLQKQETIGWITNHAIGSTMLNLNTTILSNAPVEIPSLRIQNRIVEILSRYDSLIENYQKQIKLLEEAAQRLYKEWFIDLRFPGHENTNIIDGVPEGWEKKKLHEIAEVVMGSSPKSEFYNNDKQGLPFHQGVGSYGTRFVDDNVYSTSITRLAEPNSILFSVRAPVGRLNITKNKIIIGRGLAAMNHKDGFQSFLFYMLKERFFMDNIIGNGSIFASISKVELLDQEFIVPPMITIMAFESLSSKLDKKIQGVDTQLRLLTEARDRLLPKLMSGEIEI